MNNLLLCRSFAESTALYPILPFIRFFPGTISRDIYQWINREIIYNQTNSFYLSTFSMHAFNYSRATPAMYYHLFMQHESQTYNATSLHYHASTEALFSNITSTLTYNVTSIIHSSYPPSPLPSPPCSISPLVDVKCGPPHFTYFFAPFFPLAAPLRPTPSRSPASRTSSQKTPLRSTSFSGVSNSLTFPASKTIILSESRMVLIL